MENVRQRLDGLQVDQGEQLGINAQNELTGDTQLHTAAAKGDLAVVESLIEQRADVNIKNKMGYAPIWKAAMPQFQKNIAEELITAGALVPDILVRFAKASNKLDLLNLFLEKRVADPTSMLVTIGGVSHPDVIQLALKYGADPHSIQDGETPLLHLYRSKLPSFESYRALVEADGGFTDHLISLRLAGQRFSLEGNLYERLGQRITFPSFAKTLDAIAEEDWAGHSWKHIPAESLRQAVDYSKQAKDYIRDWERDKIVTIEAGIIGHAISVVLFRDRIAIGNRGYREAQVPPGLTFYQMHAFAPLEGVITSIMQHMRHDCEELERRIMASPIEEAQAIKKEVQAKQIKFFEKEIPEVLQLTLDHQIVLAPQRTGNCGMIAAELSSLAILTFLHLGGGRYTEEAADLAFPLYNAVLLKDRLWAVKDLKSAEKQAPKLQALIPFSELHYRIFAAAAEQSESFGQLVLNTILELGRKQ